MSATSILQLVEDQKREIARLRDVLDDALDVVSNAGATPEYRKAELRFLRIRLASALAPQEATHPSDAQ